jgi:hypothetical protein
MNYNTPIRIKFLWVFYIGDQINFNRHQQFALFKAT